VIHIHYSNTITELLACQRVFGAVERQKDILVRRLQKATSAEIKEPLIHFAQAEMIHQFLAHTVNVKRGNLIDKLTAKNVLSHEQKERIKKLRKNDAKVTSLLMMLREKSSAEFASFLATLSETGQHKVADVIHQELHTAGQTGQNPLRSIHGKFIVVQIFMYNITQKT